MDELAMLRLLERCWTRIGQVPPVDPEDGRELQVLADDVDRAIAFLTCEIEDIAAAQGYLRQ